MDFGLNPDQIALRQAVREYAEGEIAPHVRAWDEAQAFPLDAVREMGRLGYMGSIFPERLGGAGMGYLEYCIIVEELARVDPSIGLIVAAHTSLCSNHIFAMGSEAQQNRYLPWLASGEWIGSWALTEPDAGSDAAGIRTRAVFVDDFWILNGVKTFTTNVHFADVCVAIAVTDRNGGKHGISAFIVEKSTDGFRAGRKECKMGMRASTTGEAVFENCRIPSCQLLGKRGEGLVDSLKILDGGRISIAALAVGIAQGAYDAARCYSRRRKQFGQPISQFQLIQQKLADMSVALEASRLLTYRAAWLMDQKQEVSQAAASAKLFASEAAVDIADEALQIHGGYGFTKDCPVEKYYRDVKLCTIGEGTSEIQRIVIARQILS